MNKTKLLNELTFDNRTLRSLPIDPIKENYVRTVKNACFSRVNPSRLDNPRLVCHSSGALGLIDISEESINDDYFVECFAGNQIILGSEPAAHCYAGHQFGVFAGQLGDGAVIYLGEIINSKNERWELQLKGAGPTPYSRQADGRKVLRSSIREFLCSETMHHLGIGTTRAATCIVSSDKVERDQFYDGKPKMEPCAIISRLAPTFIRFGSFEIFKKLDPSSGRFGPSVGNQDLLQSLVNFVIESYFPEIRQLNEPQEEKYKLFFKNVVIKTAKLIAQWQSVGFVHGVLNTDNMSIMGLTLDYGPYAFMDRFDPDHISNTSDHDGRYRFKKQPEVCFWNLFKFAEALQTLVPLEQLKEIVKSFYFETYHAEYSDLMLRKLGLTKKVSETISGEEVLCDKELIEKLLHTLDQVGGDYTNCFRSLNILTIPGLNGFEESLGKLKHVLMKHSSDLEDMKLFYKKFVNSPMVYMKVILLQNFKEDSITDNDTVSILEKFKRLYELENMESNEFSEYSQNLWDSWLDHYVKRLKFEVQDFSNNEELLAKFDLSRKQTMNSINPLYVLRNHLVQKAIEKAEMEDYSEVRKLLRALENPFKENPSFECYTEKPPKSCSIRVSCSS